MANGPKGDRKLPIEEHHGFDLIALPGPKGAGMFMSEPQFPSDIAAVGVVS